MQPRPPFAPLAVTDEFCLGSPQDARDCERVQFVSGLAVLSTADELRLNRTSTSAESAMGPRGEPPTLDGREGAARAGTSTALLLAYGVNDCEARVGRIALAELWRMLRPLPGAEKELCLPSNSG